MVSAEIDDVEAEAIKASRQLHAEKLEALKKLRTEKLSEIDTKWTDERDNLERRVHDCYEEHDLGDGTTIAIRTRLNELETVRLAEISKREDKLDKEKDSKLVTELMCELLGTITANPLFTKEYFLKNPDKYASIDLISVIVAFYKGLGEKIQAETNIRSFREEHPGD